MTIPLFDRKRQQLRVDVPSCPLIVPGDDRRLTQVFANLLNNAAKYTPEGGRIELAVRQAPAHVVIEVSDNGAGLDPTLLPRVFERFAPGGPDVRRPDGGRGIGLALVRALVEGHGGQVEARSAGPRAGSAFVIRLPCDPPAVAADVAPGAAESPTPVRKRVLLVDDNEDARWLLSEVLTQYGYEVESVGDAEAALSALDTFRPDVAILDIGLPGMDGYELAAAIRASPRHLALRLLALTGYGRAVDAAKAEGAGFERYFVKPLDTRQLLEQLEP